MKERNVERHKGDIQHDPSNTHFAIFFFPAIQKHQVRKKGSHQSIGEKMADTDFTPTVKNKCPI